MTPEQAVRQAAATLQAAGHEAPAYAARKIIAHALQSDATGLLLREAPLSAAEKATINALTQTIATGTPLWRAMGYRPFHGLELGLNAATLEPRDDTEILVEAALACIGDRNARLRFADLGTGTGAVALALLSELPNARAVLSDISADALVMARENAVSHGFAERIDIAHGDWLSPLDGRFDLIVSNPPYIATTIVDTLEAGVRDHDPRCALDGGADGLDAYRCILADAGRFLEPNGHLALEIGYDQRDQLTNLARDTGWTAAAFHRDTGGRDRAIVLRR